MHNHHKFQVFIVFLAIAENFLFNKVSLDLLLLLLLCIAFEIYSLSNKKERIHKPRTQTSVSSYLKDIRDRNLN